MSNRKKLLIRTDNSASIGLGHLMRTLLLADGLKEHFDITYLCRELEGSQNHLILERAFGLRIIKSMECEELLSVIQEIQPTLCIIDHYGVDDTCEKKIRSLCPLFVFDDEFKMHNADFILNHSFIAKPDDYDYLPNTKVLAGSRYSLLKDAFLEHKNRFTPLGSLKNKKVLITLGGTDVLRLSAPIKKALLRLEPSLHVSIVTTSANPQVAYLKRVEKNIIVDEKDMASLMQQYDLIITSASTSLLETFSLKKPFIAVQCASNQGKTVDIIKQSGLGNIIESFTPSALKRALLFVQYRPQKIKRVLEQYHFEKDGAAKEIINVYQ